MASSSFNNRGMILVHKAVHDGVKTRKQLLQELYSYFNALSADKKSCAWISNGQTIVQVCFAHTATFSSVNASSTGRYQVITIELVNGTFIIGYINEGISDISGAIASEDYSLYIVN